MAEGRRTMTPILKFTRSFAYISLLMLGPAWGDISKNTADGGAVLAETDLAKDMPKTC
jgi:hypothetical protein